MTVPLVFDIETGPASREHLTKILPPFEAPPSPGEFDPASVKTGNLKDESKVKAKIEDARRKHEAEATNWSQRCEEMEKKYWDEHVGRAALSPITGQVLAIGYRGNGVKFDYVSEDRSERDLLSQFWTMFRSCYRQPRQLVGFNIGNFDVPFLVQRSWILDLQVPPEVLTASGYLDPIFVDLMRVWSAGVRNGFVSLDAVCAACGLGKKPEGVSGAMFADLFHNPETRELALDYLSNDLEMTFRLAERLGVI